MSTATSEPLVQEHDASGHAGSMQLVSFKLGNETYGIEITKIREIILMGEITQVPEAPSYVKGLINLRSTVIPVIDLWARFSLPEVEFWVRNLERDQYAFWLQTSTDKFYPDFVAKLNDGRYLAVEYKGSHLETSADTAEKDAIGQLWAARSKGQCVFLMATKKNMRHVIGQAAHGIES